MLLRPVAFVSLGLVCLAAASALALHHPVAPMVALIGLCLWVALAVWRPLAWLWVVPAFLPVLNFSPWTGWIVFEEFDLLLLGTLAAGYFRLGWEWSQRTACLTPTSRLVGIPGRSRPSPGVDTADLTGSRVWQGLLAVLCVLLLSSLWRGLLDAGGWSFDWFASYDSALDSVRIFKSLAFALCFMPLLERAFRVAPIGVLIRLARGLIAGLAVLLLAVLWERLAFVGLTNLSSNYRTVGLFWEMHVGGAAIDGYLAMSIPFVVWAVTAARKPLTWVAAAALAVVAEYVCLTTFSRGVYLATLAPMVFLYLSLLPRRKDAPRWRVRGTRALLVVLAGELSLVIVGGSFMTARVAETQKDIGSRMEHWRNGISLLHGPADWLLGLGLGRLPASYNAHVPSETFPGRITWHRDVTGTPAPATFVRLRASENMGASAGVYALSQRVSVVASGQHSVRLTARVLGDTMLVVSLCEQHLLYDRRCQRGWVPLSASPDHASWQMLEFPLVGSWLEPEGAWLPRLKFFSIAAVADGGQVDIEEVRLINDQGSNMLENGDFEQNLAHWWPVAQWYFLPWHIDNLYLEILVERGVLTWLVLATMLGMVMYKLLLGPAREHPMAPFLVASLLGFLFVGLASSVLDVPRVAFGVFLILFSSAKLRSR